MEIIEIGAVELLSAQAAPAREFSHFLRPVVERELSDFCRRLTSIQQHDVDTAEEFGVVFPAFLEWIGEEPFFLCSWGGYDVSQFRTDCARHGLTFPRSFERHINLKKAFGNLMNIKPTGMKRALTLAGLPLEGTHHRGIDDARNIARLANRVLPILESSGVLALD
jgi:inhibitor of KinA sporulation pathway (predicted exonuclease)